MACLQVFKVREVCINFFGIECNCYAFSASVIDDCYPVLFYALLDYGITFLTVFYFSCRLMSDLMMQMECSP